MHGRRKRPSRDRDRGSRIGVCLRKAAAAAVRAGGNRCKIGYCSLGCSDYGTLQQAPDARMTFSREWLNRPEPTRPDPTGFPVAKGRTRLSNLSLSTKQFVLLQLAICPFALNNLSMGNSLIMTGTDLSSI